MILRKPISEHPDEYWDKVIEVNLSAQFILTREFGKVMAERGYGKIVFVASLLSFQGGDYSSRLCCIQGRDKTTNNGFRK